MIRVIITIKEKKRELIGDTIDNLFLNKAKDARELSEYCGRSVEYWNELNWKYKGRMDKIDKEGNPYDIGELTIF